MYTIVILVTVGLATLISCGAAFVSFFFSRNTVSVELQSDVDELMGLVQKMVKEQRKEKMSRVRQGIKAGSEDPETLQLPIADKISLHSGGNVDSVGTMSKKDLLRARMRGK